ncbi:MAG: hypothetical protein R6V06_02740 [Kiritimatiellia bacterium]
MDSNMIKGVKALKLILSFTMGLFLIAGCDQDAKNETPVHSAVPWIMEAVSMAEKIPVKLHQMEHDRCLSKTAAVALEVGVFDQTDNILKSIRSWRKADLYAKLARSCYLKDKVAEGDELVKKARDYLQGNQFEDWQVSRVHVGLEQAGHVKGKRTDANLLTQLRRADQAKLLPSMVQGNVSTTNLVDMLTRLEASTNSVMDIDIAAATIDTYRILYEKSQEKEDLKDLRKRVIGGVEKTFRNVHTSIACYKLLDFCNSAVAAGDKNFVGYLSDMLEDRLGMIRVDMRIPVLLRYSEFLIEQGHKEKSLEKLRYVEDKIDDSAIFFADKPVFLARCGVIYGKTGNTEKMLELLKKALSMLNTVKNSRPRAMTAVDFCHVCARGGVESPELLQSMKELNSNLSDPW